MNENINKVFDPCIYKIVWKENSKKVYIGASTNPHQRWKRHLATVRLGPEKCKNYFFIHAAMNKHGIENFEFIIFEKHQNKKEMFEAEIKWIRQYKDDGYSMYNLTDGGDGVQGYEYTEEHRKKMSKIMKNKFAGNKNPFYGKKHTEETKRKISETRKKNNKIENYRGEKSSQAKLNKEIVNKILDMYMIDNINTQKIANILNIKRGAVCGVIDGKTWAHISSKRNLKIKSQKEGIRALFDTKLGKEIVHERPCLECQALFTVKYREKSKSLIKRNKKYCSHKCRNKALASGRIKINYDQSSSSSEFSELSSKSSYSSEELSSLSS